MINDIFKNLDKKDQDILLYAFNNNITQIIRLSNEDFLGVNITIDITKHIIVEQQGDWFYITETR